jgi:hypothetical protein
MIQQIDVFLFQKKFYVKGRHGCSICEAETNYSCSNSTRIITELW